MKKKILITGIAVILLVVILFVPIPKTSYDDGGTREYVALTYKVVDWNRIQGDTVYDKTRIYFGDDRYKSIDTLWEIENQDKVRKTKYTEKWLEKTDINKADDNFFEHITITKIYSDCFFAQTVIPMPYEIKLNGKLSDEWCVGDQVICTYKNTYYDKLSNRVEADMITVEQSNWQPDPNACYKPVIYFYPEKQTDVSVELNLNGKLTCTYPLYKDGWKITAHPDSTLTDKNGQSYNYLYWEGVTDAQYNFTKGFCVKGEDTAVFLEAALEKLGLNRKEANEFIVFWLPLMQDNPYNIISFQESAYTDAAKLKINPEPDTLIRVFMAWKKTDKYVKIDEQMLTSPNRKGFTVVEWGGTQIGK